jgi:hypothetical protein
MSKEIMLGVTLGAAQIMEACECFVAQTMIVQNVIPDRTFSAVDVPTDLSITVVIREKRVRKAKEKT